ncbi:MAG: DUF1643 domain-containing protein [Chloroflexi bacterium]|nr:DUF1643 domain-containing protein [Chloroflexota bacterium]
MSSVALHRVCSWDESLNRRYRYWLEAALENPAEPVDNGICLFLMLNPNKADHERSDETVSRCKRLAQEWGYGTLWVCNLFPVRGGDSSALPRDLMGPHRPEGKGFTGCALCRGASRSDLHINDLHIRKAAESAGIIVCAWGGKGGFRGRSREVVALLVGAGHENKLYTFGLTKTEQQPRHAKPQLRGQWPQADDLRRWAEVRLWSDS